MVRGLRADVGGPAPVELGRGDRGERLGGAASVHGHEDVEGAVPVDDGVDEGTGHGRPAPSKKL